MRFKCVDVKKYWKYVGSPNLSSTDTHLFFLRAKGIMFFAIV